MSFAVIVPKSSNLLVTKAQHCHRSKSKKQTEHGFTKANLWRLQVSQNPRKGPDGKSLLQSLSQFTGVMDSASLSQVRSFYWKRGTLGLLHLSFNVNFGDDRYVQDIHQKNFQEDPFVFLSPFPPLKWECSMIVWPQFRFYSEVEREGTKVFHFRLYLSRSKKILLF